MGCKDFSFLSRAPGRYPHRPTHRYCRPCVSGRGLGERLAGPAAGCECSSYRQLAVSTNSRREPLIQASPYLTLDPGGAAGWKYVMRQYRVGGSSRPAARAIVRVARQPAAGVADAERWRIRLRLALHRFSHYPARHHRAQRVTAPLPPAMPTPVLYSLPREDEVQVW